MRRAAIAFLVVALAGVMAAAVVAASERRTLAFTLGVPSLLVATTLEPGQEVCQQPIAVEAAFDAIELHLGTYFAPGPRLAVTIRQPDGGEAIARAVLATGYADNSRPLVRVERVPARGTIAICIRNAGTRKVAVYGAADVAALTSSAVRDGQPTGNDLDIVLRTMSSRSTLALLPEMLDRAALFRGGWSGAWLYWALLGAVLVAVPALLLRALTAAAREPRD